MWLYVEAVGAALLTAFLSWYLRDQLQSTRLLLFWVMSALVAWRGGLGPVMVAWALAVVLWDIALGRPYGQLHVLAPNEVLFVAIYLFVSALNGRTVSSLRLARARVAQAADGMIDAMLVYDGRWQVQFVNAAGEELLQRIGVNARELRGRVIWDAVPTLRGSPFETETRRAADEQRIVEYEAEYPDAGLWLQVRCVPTVEGGVSTFVHDVTPTAR